MKKLKLFSILALLFMAATGAVAQTETLLTTITATAKEQASYSTANVATVSFSYTAYGSSAYLANWGWWGYGWIATVNAAEGYTITKCIFYDDANRTATDSEAPFVVETTEEDKTPRINGTPIDGGIYQSKGIKKIEVYGYENPTTVNVTGITLSQTEAAMTVGGETLTLTATVAPDDATDKTVTWTTSNADIATVENGVVTAVAVGTATITVTTTDGSFTATCAITVTAPEPQGETITVTWNSYDLPSSGSTFTKDGVTLTCDIDDDLYGPGTFTTDLGNFTQIVVSGDGACYIDATDGWSGNYDQKTWTGNAAIVPFDGSIYSFSSDVTIVFTIKPSGGETAVDNIQIDKAQSTKLIRNGMLLIEKNGKLYNATGAEVK